LALGAVFLCCACGRKMELRLVSLLMMYIAFDVLILFFITQHSFALQFELREYVFIAGMAFAPLFTQTNKVSIKCWLTEYF
jgi:hypothetical protein